MENFSVRKDLLSFIKHSNYERFEDFTLIKKLTITIKVLLLTYIGLYIVSLPIGILKAFGVIGDISNRINIINDLISKDYREYQPYFFTLVIIIVPILEEFSFRLSLKSFNIKYFNVSISLILGLFFVYPIIELLWMPEAYLGRLFMYYSYSLVICATIFLFLNLERIKKNVSRIKTNWNLKPQLIIYISAILFAIAHTYNYVLRKEDLIFMPLLLLPYFIYGLTFGYIRIRLGIIYSIIIHMTVNGISIVLTNSIMH